MNRSASAALAAAFLLLPRLAAAEGDDAPGTPAQCPSAADAVGLVKCALSRSEAVVLARREVEAIRGRRLTAGQILPANPAIEVGVGRRRTDSGLVDIDRGVDLSQQIEIGGQRGAA